MTRIQKLEREWKIQGLFGALLRRAIAKDRQFHAEILIYRITNSYRRAEAI